MRLTGGYRLILRKNYHKKEVNGLEKVFGKELAKARQRQGMTQEELSSRGYVARSTLAGYELNRRNIPDETVRDLTKELDDVDLYFSAWHHATGDVSIPLMNGINIDAYSSSMVFLVKHETKEALESVENMHWHLPSEMRKTESVEQIISELLDAAASMLNLVACLCKEHKMPMARIFRKWQISMKNRGYQQ